MKGLQRKCFLASASTHGLLLVLVVVASAFVSKKPPTEAPAFELFDATAILVDQPNVLTGGNPNVTTPPQSVPLVTTPAVQPTPPAPLEEPKPLTKAPEVKVPVKEPLKPAPEETPVEKPKPEPKYKEPDPNAFDLSKAVTKTVPKPEKTPSNFDFAKAEKKTIKPANEAKETSDGQENSRGEKEKRLAQARAGALSDALKHVQGGLSKGGSAVDIPGPGGPAYASYYLALRKFYETAWIPPAAGRGDEPAVEVEVVIGKDGTIISQRIAKKSGRRELDNSVQNALNRVFRAKAPKFPEGSTDEKRTFRINFDLTERLNVG